MILKKIISVHEVETIRFLKIQTSLDFHHLWIRTNAGFDINDVNSPLLDITIAFALIRPNCLPQLVSVDLHFSEASQTKLADH